MSFSVWEREVYLFANKKYLFENINREGTKNLFLIHKVTNLGTYQQHYQKEYSPLILSNEIDCTLSDIFYPS